MRRKRTGEPFNFLSRSSFLLYLYKENQCVFKLGGEGGEGDAENEEKKGEPFDFLS